jgi:hypothetical protein
MAHLPEDSAELVGDLPAQGCGQGLPDLAGLGGHVPSLSPAIAIRSSSAAPLSLVRMTGSGGGDHRLVALSGSVSTTPGR